LAWHPSKAAKDRAIGVLGMGRGGADGKCDDGGSEGEAKYIGFLWFEGLLDPRLTRCFAGLSVNGFSPTVPKTCAKESEYFFAALAESLE